MTKMTLCDNKDQHQERDNLEMMKMGKILNSSWRSSLTRVDDKADFSNALLLVSCAAFNLIFPQILLNLGRMFIIPCCFCFDFNSAEFPLMFIHHSYCCGRKNIENLLVHAESTSFSGRNPLFLAVNRIKSRPTQTRRGTARLLKGIKGYQSRWTREPSLTQMRTERVTSAWKMMKMGNKWKQ